MRYSKKIHQFTLIYALACTYVIAMPEPASVPTAYASTPTLSSSRDVELVVNAALKMEEAERKRTSAISENSLLGQTRELTSHWVLSSMKFLGVPYKWGGESVKGFDCSGFTQYVFKNSIGLVLPRRASDQAKDAGLVKVAKSDLRPGDLVFFNTMQEAFSHVGIYLGDSKFIHAPRTGAVIRVDSLSNSYWNSKFVAARRAPLEKIKAKEQIPIVK